MKLKTTFWQQTQIDGFGAHRDKMYPMPTVKYSAGSLVVVGLFVTESPGHLVQIQGIMDSSKYQQIKKSQPDGSC